MRCIFFSTCLLVSPLLSASIVSTKTVDCIQESVSHHDSDSLILFDIDQVLLTRVDMVFNVAVQEGIKQYHEQLEANHSPEELKKLESLIYLQSPEQVLDAHMLMLIQDIQRKQIPVIALTKAGTGQWGCIPSFDEYRADALKKVGIDFSSSFKSVKRISFDEFKVKHPPVFTRGVLCTGKVSKGDALRAFLSHTGFLPKRVLFIDDTRENLTNVEQACQELGIAFEGYEFTQIFDRPTIPFDRELLELQTRVLEQENRWLPDQEALRRLGRQR